MKAHEMMQRSVVTTPPDMSLAQARRLMHDNRIRHLPVVSGGRLVGIVTDRDIRNASPSPATTLSKGEINYQMDTTPVDTCMTQDVVIIDPEEDMVQGARRLLDGQFGCLPVVDGGQLVGIVTEVDLLEGFLAAATPAGDVMQVKDYMRQKPYTIKQDDLVSTAYQRMLETHIRHLPIITERNQLVGVITDRDIRQAGASTESHMAEHELTYLLAKMTVRDMMTTRVHTVRRETAVADAAQFFIDHQISCLPVVQDDGTLEGIITVTDLLQAYMQQHPTQT